jgi:hypothetical protein
MKKAAHHRRSPRLVAAERQANDEALSSMETYDNAKQQDSSSWNETSFDPYVSSSPVVRQTPHDAQEAPKQYNRRVARSTANSSSGGRHMMPDPAITARIDASKMEQSDVVCHCSEGTSQSACLFYMSRLTLVLFCSANDTALLRPVDEGHTRTTSR